MHAEGANLIDRVIARDQVSDNGECRVATCEIRNRIEITIENAIGNSIDRLTVRNDGLGRQNLNGKLAKGHGLEPGCPVIRHKAVGPITPFGTGLYLDVRLRNCRCDN